MSTLGDMKSRIYSEVHQTLSTEVQNAVLDAVKFYQGQRFYFNEAQVNFNFSLTTSYVLSNIIPKMVCFDITHICRKVPETDNYRQYEQKAGYNQQKPAPPGREEHEPVRHRLICV